MQRSFQNDAAGEKIIIHLYTQQEVISDYIASDRREQAEKNAKEMAWNFYKNGVKPDVIARSLNRNIKTIEQWLGLVPQA